MDFVVHCKMLMKTAQVGPAARYQVSVGELGQCSVPCGGGQAERPIMCTDSASGLPVDMSMCNLNISALPVLVQGCNTQRCSSSDLQHFSCFAAFDEAARYHRKILYTNGMLLLVVWP